MLRPFFLARSHFIYFIGRGEPAISMAIESSVIGRHLRRIGRKKGTKRKNEYGDTRARNRGKRAGHETPLASRPSVKSRVFTNAASSLRSFLAKTWFLRASNRTEAKTIVRNVDAERVTIGVGVKIGGNPVNRDWSGMKGRAHDDATRHRVNGELTAARYRGSCVHTRRYIDRKLRLRLVTAELANGLKRQTVLPRQRAND